jgi:hypothetical protein
MLRSVDFPQPLGPISETISPSRTATFTRCTASTPSAPRACGPKRLVTLRNSIRMGVDMRLRWERDWIPA